MKTCNNYPWNNAPKWVVSAVKTKDGRCYWLEDDNPTMVDFVDGGRFSWYFDGRTEEIKSFVFKGTWKDSLRLRPVVEGD